MLPSDRQVYSDSDESLDNFPRKRTKISGINGQSFNRDISIDEVSQNYDNIGMGNYFDHKNQNLEINQNVSSGVSDDFNYNVNNCENNGSEDYVTNSDGKFELEKYVTHETNSKTDETDGESVKDVSVGVNDYNNDEKRMTKTYKHIDIDDDELYDLLEKSYRDKNKPHNEHNKKVVTPDDYKEYDNTDSESEDYVPIKDGEFELEEYVTNETNSKTGETDGESVKDVSVGVNDYNNDEERMTENYKHIDIDDDELYDLLEKSYRDKNKPHNEHNKKVVTPDDYKEYDNTDSESEDYVPIKDGEFELEEYVTNETNSKTGETDGESVKDVCVGVNDYNNDEKRMTKTYKHIDIDDDELYDLLEKSYRDKNKPHNEHNKKVVTPDDYKEYDNTDSESEDYVPIKDGEFELKEYVTNETNSKTGETDGESVKDVCVGVNDYNNDEERMTETYKHIDIDDDELYDLLEKSYRDKNKPHNEHNKKVVTPDDYKEYDNTDSESEDYVPIKDGEFELEEYVTNETNSKTGETDGESVKDVCVGVNDYNNDEERMTETYKHIDIDDDELYDLLEKSYRDKNKPHNEHNKKVVTPDDYKEYDNTDSESEDYVPIKDGEFELEEYVTNETNSKTGETNGESVKDVSVGVNDYNNDEERMTKTYKHIDIDDDELYDLLEKSYRDKNKPHNEHNKKVVTPDDYKEYDNTDSESEDYVPIKDGEFELEEYDKNETNSKTGETDGESVKDVSVGVNDYNNDEERMPKTYKHIDIDDDELYDLLEKSYRDKNKPHNEHNKKVVTPDDYKEYDITDSESEDYVPIKDGEFELEEYVTNETNSKTGETDGESVKDVSVGVNDYNNDEERMTKTYKHLEIDDDELDDLLDKSYLDKNKPHNEHSKKVVTPDDYIEVEKTVLEEVYKNHFDILPENWIKTDHKSGMPIYLHKKSRVVTLSRPYFLGPGDPKSHLAPLSAITCLQYQKGLENRDIIKNEPDFHVSKLGDMIIPNTKVETAQENIIKESLTHVELREYCQSLFKFKVKEVKSPNKTPKEQNIKSEISRATLKNTKQRFSLPDSTKLISFPLQTEDHNNRYNRRREWTMNPNGKSSVCILHEYLQHALKTLPWYEFKELESTETPYSATVVLNDVQYGVGLGTRKKQAKLNAAQATLDILIPEMKNKIDSNIKNKRYPLIFDQIKVTDPRVIEFSAKTSEPDPYSMLLVCLQRNFGECEIGMEYKLINCRKILYQCTMTVGKHTASVPCKNKRDGKQKASQIILGLLHPLIENWGSLLRLYGNRSIKNSKEKKQEEQEITRLQSEAAVNQPNFAILNKLKEEMLKIRDQRKLKETNEMLGLPPTMLATTCPYTIAIPSSSTSPN